MSIIINNKKVLGTEPNVSPGNLGLFAGSDDRWYAKSSDGTSYPLIKEALYMKLGELDYTELNNLSYTVLDTIALTQSLSIPANSEVLKLYAKVNQPFISPSGSVSGIFFIGVTAGTSIATLNYLNVPSLIGLPDPFFTSGMDSVIGLFLTQSYIYTPVLSIFTNTASFSYSILCEFNDGTQSDAPSNNQILNPQNWISGNVSFVIQYQSLDFNNLPF